MLYIVATPIGNLGDMTRRALDVLASVDTVYAEDTRYSRRLLNHYGVQANLVSLHEHNEEERLVQVIGLLESGGTAALISDAGTPLISDPGYRLVAACHTRGLGISPVPGPSALISALSVAGLPTDSFVFLGFPPAKKEERKSWLAALSGQARTMVFYESRHRIVASLADMRDTFGEDRVMTMTRELTKQFETIRRGSIGDMADWVSADPDQQKGEYVLIVAGAEPTTEPDARAREVLTLLLRDLSVKRASEVAAQVLGMKKNALYKLALALAE
ncbi:MAG: 16S rRNA (cytidine(1402)-2'-O)-methyltransferase [Gammaproteobacteria bacterium]|nr:16S rRNA (cytidine(1402)-2'-O)-methyltransferase [Gammaproteobacteria bacterium]